VSRPRGFADLAGQRVGIYGYGIEGRTAHARLSGVGATVVLVDDTPHDTEVLATDEGGREALTACDIVLKSPGISPHAPTIVALREAGIPVTSALNLWMAEAPLDHTIAITGTKGKSTTTSLVAFFLECCGEQAHTVGNIGQPPYDPALAISDGWVVLETSSFQSVDLDIVPTRLVVTSLGSDHLDWHGSIEQYRLDKLAFTRAASPHTTFVADTEILHAYRDHIGGEVRFIGPDRTGLATTLHLLGEHSNANVGLALAVVADALHRSVDDVAARVRKRSADFVPLPGRLTLLATIDGVRYVDDGLATSALPTIAALEVFTTSPVALIVGGFDRGVDYQPLAVAIAARVQPTTVVAMGPAGERIAQLLDPTTVSMVGSMADAVAVARATCGDGGVVLFSPAAPSFDRYANWRERSDDFAACVAKR
jgi:UDP-N-acetylmuramoyl-L-alanine---L-glutamate ligase